MEETDKIQPKLPNQEFDYFKIVKILISRWYWIAASLVVCYVAASVYIWYTPKIYATASQMKLEDRKSDVSDIVTVIGSSDKGPSRVQSETYIIQSRNVIANAVKDLNYPISFFIEGRLRTNGFELYPEKPLNIKILNFDSANYYHDIIKFKHINRSIFTLTFLLNGRQVSQNFQYNNPVNIGSTAFTINYSGELNKNSVYLFQFNNPDALINRARAGLQTNELLKNSGILALHETDANPQFAADILNTIMNEYLVYDRQQKQLSATKIISFINKQLDTISEKVKHSENAIEDYKKNLKMMDASTAAQTQLSKVNDFESQTYLLKIQLASLAEFKQQILNEKENVTLNFDIEGTSQQSVTQLVTGFNSTLTDRNTLLKTYNSNSQPIEYINHQLALIKNTIIRSIDVAQERIQKKMSYLDNQLQKSNQIIATLPLAERELVSLNRDFEISEKVYNLLSEKRLDAQINRSSIGPGATIIEKAQPNFGPVGPDVSGIHRSSILFGIAIGLGLIILIRVLNPYIYDKETVESLTTIPIIGVIRKFPHKMDENNADVLVLNQPKSVFAESVRSVRTNLSFLASEKDSKVICITSEVAGEGKSFVAVNLSTTLSLIDKKVILIAADLRRSKLHKTFHVQNDKGLSNFLANQCELDEVILHTKQENLDFLPSGPIPPNPSELLHNERMQKLIDRLRLSYDIIMIDTAPVGLVSDSIPLIKISDINVFVIRSGKSKFYSATIPQRIDQEYHLNNSVIVLNAFEEDLLHSRYYTTKFTGENYGSRYYYYSDYIGYESSGYYVDSDKKKWWDIRRWFK